VPRMGLRDLRDDNALSQQELAIRAQVSKTTIVRIEAGRIRPHPSTVRKLAVALGLPPRQVMRQLRPQLKER
jgi:transcriptional regulator with XRE-family HTH domain